ncbi:hypothetical protein PQD71_gp004 [Kosakonia phage Kc263]|uniref:Uncharacterized protein n=1 Tax=Kosakonia phage Kc263 TaxID=2863194 RepID=A0AAE8BGG3_9CAUD|nr:hypothetical protein PQD71_gp004 [Kosakonia phage Kc263]QYN79897.1 hypothetical protein [Kosakonia phage Kc263]
MIIVTGTNSKKVNDPVFLSARKFMEERIQRLEAQGPSEELTIAKERYTGLTAKDVIIEPPVSFDSGIIRCCFVSRKTGFFRADIKVEKVDVRLIFNEFSVPITEYDTVDDLIDSVKVDQQIAGLVFIKSTNKYGIVMSVTDVTPDNAQRIMGDIYWDKIVTNDMPMDPAEYNSGVFRVEAVNIDPLDGQLFIIEDIKAIP